MLGRVAVPLLVVLVAIRLHGQCPQTLVYSGQFRTTYLDLAIDGNDLWAATGYGVQLFDRSADPPALVATIAVPGTTRTLLVTNGVTYAGSGSKIVAIRKSGRTLSIAGSVETGATAVNDILATGNYLYAATTSGLQQYDLLNPNAPRITTASFATSGTNVTSLALTGSLLYAADADSSVETFSISLPSLPQKTGTIESLARSTSVKTSPGRIYVSDGVMTDAFVVTGSVVTRVWNGAYGFSSFSVLTGDVLFAGGTDRRIRAIDWTTAATPVEIFAADVLANGGSVNRPAAVEVAGSRLYVAAGDAGLQTWDISRFVGPYPVRNYTLPKTGTTIPEGVSSTVWADGKLYAARTSGGITELTRGNSGYLTAGRQWDSRLHALHDGGSGFLLSSAGSVLTYWTLVSTTPVLISSGTMTAAVADAVLAGSTAFVVLSDRSVWSVDLAQDPARATRVAGASATAIARSARGIVLAEVREEGVTTLAWYSGSSLSAPPVTVSFPGASTTGVDLLERTAAIFTFNGVVLHDFGSGVSRVLPGSNDQLVHRMAIIPTKVLGLTEDALLEWDLQSGAILRKTPLPVEGSTLSFDTIAASGTASGIVTVAIDGTSQLPIHLSTRNGNSYYRKVAAAGNRLYLFDGSTIDAFSTDFGSAPRYVTSLRVPGTVDFAATPSRIFTLSATAIVTAWSPAGVSLGQRQIEEGTFVQPLALAAAGEAAWASINRGCTTGGCEKKTVVFDGATLVRTATLDGGAQDVFTDGSKAWAVFDLPAEVRVYGISNPANPALLASTAATGSRSPTSVSVGSGNAYVLGERLYTYPADTLGGRSENLSTYPADPPAGLNYLDQKIRVDGACSIIVGRSFGPQFHTTGSWGTAVTPESPSLAKHVATSGGRVYVLTEHSLEVWSATMAPPAPKRRGSK